MVGCWGAGCKYVIKEVDVVINDRYTLLGKQTRMSSMDTCQTQIFKLIEDISTYSSRNPDGLSLNSVVKRTGFTVSEVIQSLAVLVQKELVVNIPDKGGYISKEIYDNYLNRMLRATLNGILYREGDFATLADVEVFKGAQGVVMEGDELKAYMEKEFQQVPFVRLDGRVDMAFARDDGERADKRSAGQEDPVFRERILEAVRKGKAKADSDYVHLMASPETAYLKDGSFRIRWGKKFDDLEEKYFRTLSSLFGNGILAWAAYEMPEWKDDFFRGDRSKKHCAFMYERDRFSELANMVLVFRNELARLRKEDDSVLQRWSWDLPDTLEK